MARIIVFDMDGVLVDVSESYREAIRETVRHYTGQLIPKELIQQYKNQGGWNNDWALSQKIILDLSGQDLPYEEVVTYFQEIFLGERGLIQRERWLPHNGLLPTLKSKYPLAIFTGRLRSEAALTLDRFIPDLEWDIIVGDDDVVNHKPHPEGLIKIAATYPGHELWYIGDTVDDADAAAGAGVRFIGISHTGRETSLLKERGAVAVFENINQLESIL
jgi:HAD superfamily phosphatase